MQLTNKIKSFKSRIFKDFVLNILASVVLTLATQLIAYPYLSRLMTASEYGLLLTIMGIVNAVGVSLGNPLNNTRILMQSEYEKENLEGDYNPIFIVSLVINVIIVFLLTTTVYGEFNSIVIGCSIISSFILFRAYYSASYRIVISYKKNLFASLFGLLGYLLGMLITHFTKIWVYTFIFGELFTCIYIFFTAKILHDNFKITVLFRKSLKKYMFIMLAAIISTLMTYMDRFFIYPVLGVEQVSIYNVASFLGKTAGIVMTPIAGVLLTYYAKEAKITIKQFYTRTGVFTIIALVFYLFIFVVGKPITKILYPTLIEDAASYFAIANLGATVFILGNTIQPILLRFCEAKWQLIIQGLYFVLYILFGLIGMYESSLLGFCYAVLIVNFIKIIFMLCVATVSLYDREKKGV
ncbi:hypothetical protein [Paenibacillus sp. FSL E2-0190]|uniref:lipopolysaccharide biosynthesis protein n=1 Tax=Paenibacillus sp. FSL E2-0190 TaxID=2954504 RepID=UPI0030EDE1FD